MDTVKTETIVARLSNGPDAQQEFHKKSEGAVWHRGSEHGL